MSAILIASGYGSLQSNIERGRILKGEKKDHLKGDIHLKRE